VQYFGLVLDVLMLGLQQASEMAKQQQMTNGFLTCQDVARPKPPNTFGYTAYTWTGFTSSGLRKRGISPKGTSPIRITRTLWGTQQQQQRCEDAAFEA